MFRHIIILSLLVTGCGRIRTPADAIQDFARSTTVTTQPKPPMPVTINPCGLEILICNYDSSVFSLRLGAQLLPGKFYYLSCPLYITTNNRSTFIFTGTKTYSCNRR